MALASAPKGRRSLTPGLSPEAQVLLRPFSAYEELATAPDSSPQWLLLWRRPALMLLTLGVVVSLSSAGRLVAGHVVWAAVFWAWAPIYQLLAIQGTLRWVVRAPADGALPSRARMSDLFFMGHGAWYAFLLFLVAVAFAPGDPYDSFQFLLYSFILPAAMLLTIVWSVMTTYAFFRAGLRQSRRRSWAAVGSFYSLVIVALLTWYISTGQLLPAIKGL